MSATDSITVTQAINKVTVTAQGSVGLNAGGQIDGNLELIGNLTVGQNGAGKDVRFYGATSNKYFEWDASQDKVIITGDLQVDGTTTTINSTVVSIADPVFSLGGTSVPTSADSKDRGIEHFYYDTAAGAGKRGFFGYSNADNAYKFLTDCPDPSGAEIFTGTAGKLIGQDFLAGTSGKFGWSGDTDTFINNLGDRILFSVGGLGFADFSEGAQDIVHFNYNENQDIDFKVGYNGGTSIFSEGSSGNVTFGGNISLSGTNKVSFGQGHSVAASSSKLNIIGYDNSAQINLITQGNAGGKAVNFQTGSHSSSFATVASIDDSGNLSLDGTATVGAVTASGTVTVPQGTAGTGGTGSIVNASFNDFGLNFTGNNKLQTYRGTTVLTETGQSGALGYLVIGSTSLLGFAANAAGGNPGDVSFSRVSSGVLGLGTGALGETDGTLLAGAVGISTTAPDYRLDIGGDTASTSNTLRMVQANGGTAIRIGAGGLSNDVTLLRVDGGGDPPLVLGESDSAGFGFSLKYMGSRSGNANSLSLFSDNQAAGSQVEAITIFQDGKVGLSNTNPLYTLDITGGIRFSSTSVANGDLLFMDDKKATFGNAGDLRIYHDGSNSHLYNASGGGDLYVSNTAADEDVIFQVANASSGTENYIILDGSARTSVLHKTLKALDNINIQAGTDGDLRIYHNGTDSTIANVDGGGDLLIENYVNDKDIIFQSDDGSGGVAEYFRLDGSQADGTNVYTQFPDNSRIALGASNDFQLYHNGSSTRLVQNTGNLSIEQQAADSDIVFQADDGSGGTATYMTIDGSREEVVASKPLIQSPGTVDPANNGELAFTVVSNTSIKIKYKGTDGVVRSTSLTLS